MSIIASTKPSLAFVLFCVAAFAFSRVAKYFVDKDVPPFLMQMEQELPRNPSLLTRVGERATFETRFNEHDLLTDTLPYSFSLHGLKGAMRIKGYAVKRAGSWVPVKSDTLFTQF
jgi:hypothetical protein